MFLKSSHSKKTDLILFSDFANSKKTKTASTELSIKFDFL
jgi:hypothetical protein